MWIYSMFPVFHTFVIDAPCSSILLSLLHIIKQCKAINPYLATNSASVIPLLYFVEHFGSWSVFAVWSSSAVPSLAPSDSSSLHRHSTPILRDKNVIEISLSFSFLICWEMCLNRADLQSFGKFAESYVRTQKWEVLMRAEGRWVLQWFSLHFTQQAWSLPKLYYVTQEEWVSSSKAEEKKEKRVV